MYIDTSIYPTGLNGHGWDIYWYILYCISTFLVLCVYSTSVMASNTSCPTWFYYNNVTCECGGLFGGAIHCNQQEMTAEIADGFCATSTEQEGLYYAGTCPFRHTENNTDRLYSEMPSDPDLLNDTMCGPYNRKGLLCGRCIDGYGPAVYSIIHILWKPFSFLTNKVKITSVTSDAVIHAFATFILLSASTLTFNGMIVFTLSPVHRSIDGTIYKSVLYCDPTITAYSHEHILYGVLAVLLFIFLVLIPSLLLCVYPTRIYGCLSRVVSGRKRLAITAFAEALNNCFKDGLNGTRDYRSLAGLFLSYALSVQSVIYVTKFIATGYDHDFSSAFTLIFLSLVISYVRPCKSTIANLSLSYHHIMAGILSLAIHLWTNDLTTETEALEMTFVIIPVISHILILMWAAYTLTHRIMKHLPLQLQGATD